MSKRTWRRVHLGDEIWRYRVGRGTVVILGPDGHRFAPGCHEIKGNMPSDFERGRHKRTSDGAVMPSEVKRYIETAKAAGLPALQGAV